MNIKRFDKIAVVSLDVTGTLINVKGTVGSHYNNIFQSHGLHFDEDNLNRNFLKCFKEKSKGSPSFGSFDVNTVSSGETWWSELVKSVIVTSTMERHDANHVERDRQLAIIDRLPPSVYSDLYHRFGGDLARQSNVDGVVSTSTDNIHDYWYLYPEVKDTLEYLRANKKLLTIISNFDERVHTILRLLGIADYFKTSDGKSLITTSIDTGYSKPHQAIFQSHLDMIRQVDPSITKDQVLYVGDKVDKDLEGSSSFGFKSLLIDRKNRHQDIPQQSRISTLADLKTML
ncbi:hypothetical protein SAMD00019534_030170 [Acytostelium subglobosum LB1]|uniref:hypothetical protein n=1 Tax=Acytostelium subglobosum LB1 TaxID=1410327 RepID=UPI000644E23A|nr:hypothetical protein SAMD00019534_030170 [Acytostelium subglobosum LB1]GAM19842.1 hypothetical protein SAMD00019534_030170 [Acytostelium subglobosum LB1]|eukprot:XP_012756604.1 hypothetical protein SAMD00019534_030170 [Acytostelium subglobosum LB1]